MKIEIDRGHLGTNETIFGFLKKGDWDLFDFLKFVKIFIGRIVDVKF